MASIRRPPSLLLGTALAWAVSCEPASPPLLTESISGTVSLAGPVPGATVTLRSADPAGVAGATVATTSTDAAGRFSLSTPIAPGNYVLEAEVPGGDAPLRAILPSMDYGEQATRQLGPFSTWAAALVDGARASGTPDPLAWGLEAAAQHLGFDPAGSSNPLAVEPRLLEDAFLALSARASRAAGASPTAITPAALLAALIDDASHDGRMDGAGPAGNINLPAGPGHYALSEDTLRGLLATAVMDTLETDAWKDLEVRDVRGLLDRLRCSGSAAFPPCGGSEPGPLDTTPPEISLEAPAASSVLRDLVTVRATARDAESGVVSLTLSALNASPGAAEPGADGPGTAGPGADGPGADGPGADGPGAVGPGPDADPAPDALSTALDTRDYVGTKLSLRLTAVNGDGATSTLDVEWPLDNLPSGVLRGVVFKGPAAFVEVEARSLSASGQVGDVVAQGLTDALARFELTLPEYQGGLLLRARGRADGTSRYINEAGVDEQLTWDFTQTLDAFVPAFSPDGLGRDVTLSPLTDLAAARTRALTRAGKPLEAAWSESLTLLGGHFGVSEPLTVRPTSPEGPAHTPPTEADRYLLALACLSQQARTLGEALRPEAPETFTPLDLLALYRADLEGDGVLDGQDGERLLDLPENALRVELARACVQWLESSANSTGLTRGAVAALLEDTVTADASALFDRSQAVTPLSDTGPEIEPPAVSSLEGYAGPQGLAGPVLLTLVARDPAGVTSLSVALVPPAPGALALVDASAPGHQVWALDTRRVPDGAVALVVTAENALGLASERRAEFRVDNTAPTVQVALDGAPVAPGADVGTRRSPVRARVEVDEPCEVSVSVEGVEVVRGPARAGHPLDADLLFRAEGRAAVEVRAVDALGNASPSFGARVLWDETPPVLEVEATDFVDERLLSRWPMPENLRAAGLPRVVLDEASVTSEDGALIARQVQRWTGPGTPANPVVLRLLGRDSNSDFGALAATWRRAPGRCFLLDDRLSPTRDELTAPIELPGDAGTFELPLDAETFGFDPLAFEGEPEVAHCLEITLRDAVGNERVRAFGFRTRRVAPAVEITVVPADELRGPRLADLGSDRLDEVLVPDEPGDPAEPPQPLAVAAFRVRNPHPELSISLEARLPAVEIVVHRQAIERWDGPFFTGFTPPPCWDDPGGRVDEPPSWSFLVPQRPEAPPAGDWLCEPMVALQGWPLSVEASLAWAITPAPYEAPGRLLLDHGPDAAVQEFTVALVPARAPGRVAGLLDAAPVPELDGASHAALRQGPGRIQGLILDCGHPPCLAWYEAARGEQLTSVDFNFDGATWGLFVRHGRYAELHTAVAGPEDTVVETP